MRTFSFCICKPVAAHVFNNHLPEVKEIYLNNGLGFKKKCVKQTLVWFGQDFIVIIVIPVLGHLWPGRERKPSTNSKLRSYVDTVRYF